MALRKKGIASLVMGACVLMSSLGTTALAAGANAKGADSGVGLNIPVTKVIMGRDWTAEDKYEFTLSAIGETEGVTLPAKTTLEINDKSVNHTGKFEAVTFTKEVKGALFQVAEKDGDTWVLSADAKEDKDGNLAVTYAVGTYDAESEKFTAGKGAKTVLSVATDKADAEEGSVLVNWPAMISMEGRDFTTKDNFGLKFKSNDATNPMPGENSRQLALGEKNLAYLVVGPIAYTEAGTYEYTVSQDFENAEDKDTVQYDAAEYKVTVEVTEGEDGALAASTKVTNKAGAEVEMMSFVNKSTDEQKPGGSDNKPGDGDNKPGDGDEKPGDVATLDSLISRGKELKGGGEDYMLWLYDVRDYANEVDDADLKSLANEYVCYGAGFSLAKDGIDEITARLTYLKNQAGDGDNKPGDGDETPGDKVDLTGLKGVIESAALPITDKWMASAKTEVEKLKIDDKDTLAAIDAADAARDDAAVINTMLDKLSESYVALGGKADDIKRPVIEAPAKTDPAELANLIREAGNGDMEVWLTAVETEIAALKAGDAELTTMIEDLRKSPEDAALLNKLVNKLTVIYKDLGGTEDLSKVVESVTLAISGTVELNGREWTDADEFTFELSATDEGTKKAVEDGKIVMPDVTAVTVNKAVENHTFGLGGIEFKEASPAEGYVFTVQQTNGGEDGLSKGMTYDIQVFVTEKDGKLSAECKVSGDVFNPDDATLKFDIDYAVEALKYSQIADISLEGRKFKADDAFELVFEPMNDLATESMELPEDAEQRVVQFKGKDGADTLNVALTEVVFKKAGDYSYKLYQHIPDDDKKISGVTYDTTEYFVNIKVTDDMKGHLKADLSITDKDGKDVTKAVFKNTWKDSKTNSTDKKDDNKTNTTTTSNKKNNKVTPQTGVGNNALVGVAIGGGVAVIAGAGAGLYYLNKKRKEDESEDEDNGDNI